jgi:hypothetical protein
MAKSATLTPPSNKTTEKFVAHENLIVQAIERQAGTVGKSVLEAVMNGIDAKASKIIVAVTEDMIVIEDDGEGFSSREQIMEVFRVFGQPHELDENGVSKDARYGTFRIGRGQLFAFGINVWTSNQFEMNVDFRHRFLDFDVEEHAKKSQKGCTSSIIFG